MVKTFVCLANSRKKSGRCVAGKTTDSFEAFRPIGISPTEELAEIEMRYSNGQLPTLLDIISVEVKGAKPNQYQKENYLIDTKCYWEFKGKYDYSKLDLLCDDPSEFWTGLGSTTYGKNDRIKKDFINQINKSFLFLKLEKSTIIVREEGREYGNPKRKVRLEFNLNGQDYILPVTHPEIERLFLGKYDGEYPVLGKHYVSLSSGVPHTDGRCYIFAAGIIANGLY